MLDYVEHIRHVHFYYHAFLLSCLSGMDHFLDEDVIVEDMSSFDEASLIMEITL